MPSPCHASLCLRQALLLKATPSLPVSVHRRCMPRLCFAITEQCVTLPSPLVAQRVCAVAIRSLSQLGCSTPLRIGSLPVLRGAVRFLAHPSPIAPMLCRRLRAALPCSSLAALDIAMPILRRSRLSRAFPSPHRANQSASSATPLTSAPSRCSAKPRKSFAAHIVAVPSHFAQGLATLFRRTAAQCHANPSPHNASHGSSVAHHRNAPLSRRYSGSEPSVHSKRPLPLLRHWPMPRNWP